MLALVGDPAPWVIGRVRERFDHPGASQHDKHGKAGERSRIRSSFALTLGGLVLSGFSHSAGVFDTSTVIAVINASECEPMNRLVEVPGWDRGR